MRILVVDDEQIMLDSICHILAKEPGLQVETARTGREAIEKAEILRPELVMMDLKMPGINGLEALTEIRRLDSQVVLIIISAYESFNYAQEAIRLNVFDYLVKPINKKRLVDQIEKVRQYLAKIRSSRQEELALRERYKKLLPLIENELLWELMNGIDAPALGEYQELLAEELNAGFFLAVSYHDKTAVTVLNAAELGFFQRQKTVSLGEEIRHIIPCFVGTFKTNPFLVFVPLGPGEENDIVPKECALKILTHLQRDNQRAEIRIGIGRIYKTAAEMKRSCQEAIQAVNYRAVNLRDQNQIYHYDDLPGLQPQSWETDLKLDIQDVLAAIRSGNEYQVRILMNSLVLKYAHLDEPEQDRLFFYLLEFLLAASWIGQDSSKYWDGQKPSFQQTVSIFLKSDPGQVLHEISQKINALAKTIKEGREKQVKSIIRQAKEMIDHRFCEPLNLEDVSHGVGISPFYFSRLFREELGVSFSEYVTKLRMEKAIALLLQGFSVKECCFSVGYHDPNYFSRIFRKYYDISPSVYREEKMRIQGGETLKND